MSREFTPLNAVDSLGQAATPIAFLPSVSQPISESHPTVYAPKLRPMSLLKSIRAVTVSHESREVDEHGSLPRSGRPAA